MADLQKTIKGLRCHSEPKFGPDEYFCETCPYDEATCGLDVPNDALSLLKVQESSIMTPEKAAVLQGFLLDIPSSESILNSVNCHAISLEDASRIIAICAYACDVMSPSGFIGWLKERLNQDLILKGCVTE